ncbi:MAG: polysaccharide deacetylase family protein, partial [Bacteroidales bacterium]|nr:polysaccharide deacetylase family protein [Bacteroidales bacterium]
MNLLSFDIEEWFLTEDSLQFAPEEWHDFAPRLEQNTRNVLALLEKHRQPAVFFLLGWVAEQYPQLVRDIAAAGHEIGYHSFHHHHNDVLTPAAFEEDLIRGLELLEELTGKRPVYYRSPYFSMHAGNLWTIPILIRHGIKLSSSIRNLRGPAGQPLPDAPFQWEHEGQTLWEFPLAGARLAGLNIPFAGSGYFRLLPGTIVQHFVQSRHYNMLYFHPRDFDPDPPRSKRLSTLRNLKNTWGTSRALAKLE